MKNIWRDYWKGQTYNASALWGSCVVKHGDVVPNVFFIKKAHISYACCWKTYPSAFLYSSVSACGRMDLSV